jgi:hypothetical protein
MDGARRDRRERQPRGRRASRLGERRRGEARGEPIEGQARGAEAARTGRAPDQVVARLPGGRDDQQLGVVGPGGEPVRGGGEARRRVGCDQKAGGTGQCCAPRRIEALARARFRRQFAPCP